jgi:GMP synthase (glutamine-hydrolysing)
VLRTGAPVSVVADRVGSFAALFAAGFGARDGQASTAAVVVDEFDVTAGDEDTPLPDTTDWAGAVMTGSPAYVGDNVPWMRFGIRLVRHLVAADIPFLGVCFGHQLLGVACGADVGPNPRGREMGTTLVTLDAAAEGDPLLTGLPTTFPAQVTHRDVIRAPGDQLTVLASAPHDPHHAVRAGPRQWGVQFHPEFDDAVMRQYLEVRGESFDAERGVGSAAARLASIGSTTTAASLLPRFATLAVRGASGPRLASTGASADAVRHIRGGPHA